MELHFSFSSMTEDDIYSFAKEGKIIVLINIGKFYIKGPVRFKFCYTKDQYGNDMIDEGVYSIEEINHGVTFFTSRSEDIVLNWWYSDLQDSYEDILRRLVLFQT